MLTAVQRAKKELEKAEKKLKDKKAVLREIERKERQKLVGKLLDAATGMNALLSLEPDVLISALSEINEKASRPEEVKKWKEC